MEYLIHLAILVCLYLILAQSLNLTFGLGRLFNLSHIAVYAIGAYATAILSTEQGWGVVPCVLLSMVCSGLFALLIGAISLRLEHDYFAIGSLAFAAVVNALLVNWKSLTRGVLGIPGIPRPEIFAVDFYNNTNFLLLIGCSALIANLLMYLLFRSSFAARLRAQAEHREAAMSLAISIGGVRNQSFVISSVFAGLAGAFFSYYINYVDPSSFGLHEMVFVMSIVIVGRPGSFWGCAAATVFLVLLPEPLRFLDIPPSVLGPMRQMLHALILFAVVFWKRETLFPLERRV
jgi:branched-chain amino acid transport system permease protein